MRSLVLVVVLWVMAAPVLANEQVVPNGIRRSGGGWGTGDVDVAVVDTGIDVYHDDLNVVGGYDCTGETKEALYDSHGRLLYPHQDLNGHGTHVAGIIAAKDDNKGVVGMAPGARLWAVKVLDKNGKGSFDDVTCGLEWVLEHADIIDVVNLSLGGDFEYHDVAPCYNPALPYDLQDRRLRETPYYLEEVDSFGLTRRKNPFWVDQELHQAICDLVRAGVPVVVAAGNGGGDAFSGRPSAYDESIVVSSYADFDGEPGGKAALDAPCALGGLDDRFYDYRNMAIHPAASSYHGKQVDIAAPGVCVFSTYLDNTYAYLTGTSMAAPHVTGAIALYLQEHPEATVDDVRQWLLANAIPQPENFGDVDQFHEPLLYVPREKQEASGA